MGTVTHNPVPPVSPPHTVLFLHGLFRARFLQTGRLVADLLSRHLETPVVSAMPDVLLDDGGRCPRYRLSPGSKKSHWHPVDIVEVTYDDIIQEQDRHHALIARTIRGFFILFLAIPRFLWHILCPYLFAGILRFPRYNSSIDRNRRLRLTRRQVGWLCWYSFCSLLSLAVPTLTLIGLVLGLSQQVSTLLSDCLATSPEIPTNDQESESDPKGILTVALGFFALLLTARRIFVNRRFADKIRDDARSIFAVIDYQRPSSVLRSRLVERIRSVIAACAAVRPGQDISIVAYSQGALLGIDTLFQPDDCALHVPNLAAVRIRLLATFGCPLEVVTRLWPKRRRRLAGQRVNIEQWLNIFESTDQLGGPLSKLVETQGIQATVCDQEFRQSAFARRRLWPHQAYWIDAECPTCRPVRRIARIVTR